jgi:hypothetical protein
MPAAKGAMPAARGVSAQLSSFAGRILSILVQFALVVVALGAIQATPVYAKDTWDARITAIALTSKRTQLELDDIDSSGFGITGEIGYEHSFNDTEIRIEVDVRVFDYKDESRDFRETYGATAQVTQQVAKDLEIEVAARYTDNVGTLEGARANEVNLRAQVNYSPGKELFELSAEYRARDYDDTIGSEGEGYRLRARWRHRFGNYHWVRTSVTHDSMSSDYSRRGYDRTSMELEYSHPIVFRLRVQSSLEYRIWEYEGRHVGNDLTEPLRKDQLFRPEIGIAYGGPTGFYTTAKVGYDWRTSNDQRFEGEGPRARVAVGFRF